MATILKLQAQNSKSGHNFEMNQEIKRIYINIYKKQENLKCNLCPKEMTQTQCLFCPGRKK